MSNVKRTLFEDLDLNLGKRIRLQRIRYEHGPGNGIARASLVFMWI
jgi:hypothetical protein